MAVGPNDLVTLAQAYAWLQVLPGSDDTNLQFAISAYSQLIADWCSRTFVVSTFSEVYDGHDNARMMIRNYPIISVASLAINDLAVNPATSTFGPGYTFKNRSVDLMGGAIFYRGLSNVAITYTAGLNPIPIDLQMACLEWMKVAYNENRDRDPNVVSQRAGDTEQKYQAGGSVTILPGEAAAMPASVYAVLSQYRNTLPV
ncbi:hypothetical protein A6U86_05485 [Rhizobium sp. AC27/96]|uniref:hypothetical protein n=1 Tax=Rhizobium sp. AC27/96 TaxID=1841653 RepID=UPI0008290E8E|nr:hypothetical protein [Rhizobium sp. AC27/96]OCJ12475.1 hypothetical protein A6U86_05485 [Rhizobium sp. AC27/96]